MNTNTTLLGLLAFLCAAGKAATTERTGELDQLLMDARSAAGWDHWEAGNDLCIAGSVTYQGVEETFDAVYARDGRFLQAFEGSLSRRVCSDGESVRLAEYSTLSYELEFFDREVELVRGLVHGGAWLDPQVGLVISLPRGWEAAAGHVGLDLRLSDGLLQGRLELDAKDHLIRSFSLTTGNGVMHSEYGDHRAVDGLQVAHRVRCDLAVGSEYSFEVSKADMQASAERFAHVADRLDYSFDDSVPPDVDMILSPSKHLWVRALVNGEDLGLFLFDTGAGFSGISRAAADALGLDAFGESSLTGLGGGVTKTRMRRVDQLQIGPLVIDNLVCTEVSVERKSRMVGETVAGVLGWDVMRRAIVDLQPRGELRLYDRAGFELTEGEWAQMFVHYQVPFFRGDFPGNGDGDEDREGLFMLDCGAAGVTVMFFHQAAQALGLLDREAADGPETTGHGAGGETRSRLSHIPWFDMAGQHIEDLDIILSTAPDGEGDPYSVGLIGGGLLRLYRLVFDVSEKRVAVIPL